MMRRLSVVLVMATIVIGGFLSTATAQQGDDAEATIAALQTQVAGLQATKTPETAKQTPTPTAGAATEGDAAAEASGAINVELILDVSGSMAQVLDTGETRIDAAKRVLNGVIAAIPERKGVSVGLRIYGHEGDNTEAGKGVSCKSSELVVPVKGVDKDRLNTEIEALQPTGWTPIALSLQRAAKDFPKASDGVTNAIVLVTDGLETCGGDPAKAAATLRSGSTKVSTNVIGFALTGDEQQTLASIAENGNGKLLGANNADELSTALFSVLKELKIVVGNGYIGGNAFSLLPAGKTGELAVIAVGPLDISGSILPVVVRNNTASDVVDVKISGVARDVNGQTLAVGASQFVRPHHVRAGTVTLGYVYFGGVAVPPDARFEFSVEGTALQEARFDNTRDLEIVEASLFEDRVVGEMKNPHEGVVKGPIGVSVACFDLDGNLLSHHQSFVDPTQVPLGKTVPFQTELYGLSASGCPAFLVAGSGNCPTCGPFADDAVARDSGTAKAVVEPDEQNGETATGVSNRPTVGGEVTVASYDIYFEPKALTIPADTDTTINLTNNGAAPHNFSIDELRVSIDVAPGQMDQKVTINAPAGTYEYYCNVPGHKEAGMIGTLNVQ